MFPSLSIVRIPENATVEELMQTQPFLLNCILSITSTVCRDDTEFLQCLALEKHAISAITNEVLINGSKTVELVKCLILLSVWHNIPEFFKTRRYHILNQMAVTLLFDLDMMTRQSFVSSGETKTIRKSENLYDDIEYRVLMLSLYCTTVGFCLILRRTIYVKWAPYVEECCVILENSLDESYKNIALFLRLTKELEKVHHIVHSLECFVTKSSISTYTMTELSTRLSVVKSTLPKDNHILLAYYYSIEAYLFQPLSEDLQVQSVGFICTEELTTRALNTISQCTASCLKAMDEFKHFTGEQVAGLPLFHFTRIIYTVGILMRLRYFILSLPSNIVKDLVPRSAILSVLNLLQRISAISAAYPTNFLMKKMKLILRLFVQTYVTQVNELLARNTDGSESLVLMQISKSDYKNVNEIAYTLIMSRGSQMRSIVPHGLHLDLLSSAAMEHRKSLGIIRDGKDEENKLNGSPLLPQNVVSAEIPVPTDNLGDFSENQDVPLLPLQEARLSAGEIVYDPNISNGSGPYIKGGVNNALPPRIPPPLFRPVNRSVTPAAPLNGASCEVKDPCKDFFELDDEFWSSLLTTDADKYLFAQDVPAASGSVLYSVFN